jgi:membrane-anchored mycosin MYCP
MVSSIQPAPAPRQPCGARPEPWARLLTAFALLAAGLVNLGATASLAPRCASAPPAGSLIADVPWSQQRYDLAALGRITDGGGVTVAVIDSGVDARHPQLSMPVRSGGDLLDPGQDGRLDCVGHGTAVASIIAAQPVAGMGLRGLAPGVNILPVRVSERFDIDGAIGGRGSVASLAAGIRDAVAKNVEVINLSISTTEDDPKLRAAVAAALAADIVVVAAVGNQHARGDPTPYPADYPGVLGVGAIGRDGLRVASSQVGSYVDIVAPGDGVIGAVPRRGHRSYQGTSFATPFVAATAALMRAHRPELRQADVVRRLLATADPAPGTRPSREYGHGVLNPIRAVTEILPDVAADSSARPVRPIVGPVRPATEREQRPSLVQAFGVAAVMVFAAAGVAAVAAATPVGRRRRWRPGHAVDRTTPLRPR